MRKFLFLGDKKDVIGVWEVDDEVSATRLRLRLGLMYPNCETVIDRARDYEALKKTHTEFKFCALQPDRYIA